MNLRVCGGSTWLRWRWLLPGLLCAVACGCGGGPPYKTVGVSGKITYDDGSLIKAERIELIFYPQVEPIDPKTHPRQARADVNPADGTFATVSTYQYGDGAIVGPHKAVVLCYDKQERWTNAVPAIYRDPKTTPLAVDIKKGMGSLPLQVRRK